MSLPALLFDLDGTLIESDPLHAQVYVEMFAARGIDIDERFYFTEIHGRQNTEVFRKHLPDEDPNELHLYKEAAFRDLLGASVDPMPGIRGLLDRAMAQGWGVAVVTNAPRLNADAMLKAIGLTHHFPTVVIGEECERGKPDPAPYHAAMALLGTLPDHAIAFEDSAAGLRSARASGAFTIGVRSSLDHAALTDLGAHATIQDFNDTALPVLLERLEGAIS
jgi:HAD superfamily hydrolase (TIGR01509 family)